MLRKILLMIMCAAVLAACSDDDAPGSGQSSLSSTSASASSSTAPVNSAPEITITSPQQNETVSGLVTVSGMATDDGTVAGVFYSTNGGVDYYSAALTYDNTNWRWNHNISFPSGSGKHTISFAVYAVDDGQLCSATNHLTFYYEAGSVTNRILQPVLNNGACVTNSDTIPLSGYAADLSGISSVNYQINGNGWQSAGTAFTPWSAGPVVLSVLSNYIQVRAVTVQQVTNITEFVVFSDTQRPVVSTGLQTNSVIPVNVNQTMSVSISDNHIIQTLYMAVDGTKVAEKQINQAGSATGITVNHSFTATGSRTVQFYARDAAGNYSLTNSVPVTVAAVPQISVTAPANNSWTTNSSVLFSGTASVDGSTITNVLLRLDGTDQWHDTVTVDGYSSWSNSITLSPGYNKVWAKAVAATGLFKEWYTGVSYDPDKPLVSINAPSSNVSLLQNEPLTVTVSASDSGSGLDSITLYTNGILYQSWTSDLSSPKTVVIPGFQQTGSVVLTCIAKDKAGWSSTTASRTISVVEPLLTQVSIEWYKGGDDNGTLTWNYTLAEMADYFLVVTAQGTPPSVDQVKAGQDATGSTALFSATDLADSGVQVSSDFVTGLFAGNSYYVYMVADDGTRVSKVVYGGSFTAGQNGTAPLLSDLIITEYIEGTGDNKAIEVYNGTGAPVNMSNYQLELYLYGGAGSSPTTITGSWDGVLATGSCYVFANSGAVAAITDAAQKLNGSLSFSGDDVIILRRIDTGAIVDSIGSFIEKTEWGTDLCSTTDNTLRRKRTVTAGDTDPTDTFDPDLEWIGYATDTFGGLGSWQE